MYHKKTFVLVLALVLSILLVACLPVENIRNTATPVSINKIDTTLIPPTPISTATPFPTMYPWPSSTPQTLSSFPEEYKYVSLNCKEFAEFNAYNLDKPPFMGISFDSVENLYVYNPENGQIIIYDTEGEYTRTIDLPNEWTRPLDYFPFVDVPIFDNKIWFPTGGATTGKRIGSVIETLDLDSGHIGIVNLPTSIGSYLFTRRFFVDKQGMYLFGTRCDVCDNHNYFLRHDGHFFETNHGVTPYQTYYSNGFLFELPFYTSSITVSKLDSENEAFIPIKSFDIGVKSMRLLGVDKDNSVYIELSPYKSPYFIARVSFDGKEKELLQIPQKYFSENMETDIFVADSGTIFILTIEDKKTTAYTKITRCYISKNSE